MTKVSIIISNFNYGLFLADAIESALRQTYNAVEVIAIDDGSTDSSTQVLQSFSDRIRVFRRAHQGETATRNFGFRQSTGDLVCFLDSDDILYPDAVARVIAAWRSSFSKLQYPMQVVDSEGRRQNLRMPRCRLDSGNVAARVLSTGRYITAPGSGNFYPRWLLESIMPVPESEWPQSFDSYAGTHAAFSGEIGLIPDCLAYYRVHGSNISSASAERRATLPQLNKLIERTIRLKTLIHRLAAERRLIASDDVVVGHWLYLKLALSQLRLSPGSSRIAIWSTVRKLSASALVAPELTFVRRLQLIIWAVLAALMPGKTASSVIDLGFDLAPRSALLQGLRRL